MIEKLGHIGLTVADLERSERFYSEVFEFKAFFKIRRQSTDWLAAQVGYFTADIEFCHMRHEAAGLHLELCKYHAPTAYYPKNDDTYVPGASHINFWVSDAAAATERIRTYLETGGARSIGQARFMGEANNLSATMITDGPQAGGRGYYMRDPDGHTIEIWEPAKTQAASSFGK